MHACQQFRAKGFLLCISGVGLTLLVAVACGAAATATPRPTDTLRPPVVQVATPAPTPATVATPLAKPTPTPTPVLVPNARVHPGKVTIMVGNLGNERFDAVFWPSSAPEANYGRIMGGLLISTNERTEMVPGIASQWGLSADGLTWTFTIRKGVKWHDGSELTPQDVLWTRQHSFGPQAFEYAVHPNALRVSRLMDKIELSGPDKVSLTTKQPVFDIAFLNAEAGNNTFAVIPKRAKLHDTDEEAAYDNNPVGAGFMRLVKHVPASAMKFERFDDFYYQPKNGFPEDKRVNFQALDMFLVPEEATTVAAVRAGEVDLVPVSLASKKGVEAGGGRLVFAEEGVYVSARLLGCWEPQHPCHDRRVRQALSYAIDKELIRDRLYGGPQVFQVKGWDKVTPSTIGYSPELDPRPFDPGKARQLLADAGYPGGKAFGRLTVNTYAATTIPLMPEAAQLVAESWKRELGLDVEVKVTDDTGIRKKWFGGELKGQVYWRENAARNDATSGIASDYSDPKSPSRMTEDPEIFRLAQETLQMVDPDKRAEAYKRLLLRLRDESYDIGIGYGNIPWAVGPRILTWRPYPLATWPSALHTITLK